MANRTAIKSMPRGVLGVANRAAGAAGFHLTRKHFYSPIPEAEDIEPAYWESVSELTGVDLNIEAALELLNGVFPRYMSEFRSRFRNERGATDPDDFYLINGTYMAVDAHAYYAMIRHGRARRIVEIGSGNSTRVAGAACRMNAKERGEAPRLTAIEPYPPAYLRGIEGLTEVLQQRVQRTDISFFTSLERDDILFIDSSHVLRTGNDVEYEYLEILPRLRSGVLVHVHDVSLPRRYPRCYFDQKLYWNEQQLLQAFLAFNSRIEVIWPGNAMMLRHPERMLEVFPEIALMRRHFPLSEPTAFWMRVR
jgi:hypothetical protein